MALVFTLVGVLVAVAAQAALILFLLNLGPVGIDTGEPVTLVSALTVNLALLLGFGAIHSLMARPRFKQWWTTLISERAERGMYMLVAGLTLAAVVHFWSPMPQMVWSVDGDIPRMILYALFGAGLFVVFWAIFAIDFLHFHGVRQATSNDAVDPPFTIRGPYRFARHPIQSGLIVALWAAPDMSLGHLLFAAGMTAYSLAATLALEEPDLHRSLGDKYRDYASRVPAIIPRLGFSRRQ